MSKMKIAMFLTVLAVVSFGVSLLASLWMGKSPGPGAAARSGSQESAGALDAATMPSGASLAGTVPPASPKEKQLDDLIHDVRLRLEAGRKREAELEQREKRLAIAQELLKKQIEEMENLKIQLVAPLAGLKEEQRRLQETRIAVASQEMANLKKAAAIYEKMEAASASRIIESMCQGAQDDDAVRILHFMSERAAAKLMAEFSDKSLGGRLTEKMKRVKEEG